jgi:protein O-mannosyl-transferase
MTVKRAALAALIVVATLAAYEPALTGGFIWDDDNHVTQNLALRSPAGLRTIWLEPGFVPSAWRPDTWTPTQYYPLLHTSFWIDYRLFGLRPFGYHLVNVLLHAAVSLLAWTVLRRLRVPGAALAAAVFALHPVHVESVAWITERKNLLSAVFYLGSALCYLRFSPPEEDGPRSGERRAYALSLLLFGAALLTKTVTLTLPAALGLVLWWKRGRLPARELRGLAPMAALGVALALVTIAIEKMVAGAGAEWSLTFAQRCLIAARALCFYAGKLAWPARQAFIYPQWQVDAADPRQWAYPVLVLAVVGAAWVLRHRLGRGPLAALLFFAGTLLPALGFVDYYTMRFSYVADHYQYLASLGLIALACAGAARAAARLSGGAAARLAPAAAVVLLAVLGALTFRHAHAFRSNEALWRSTLAVNPRAWMALNNLALEVQQDGRYEEGLALLREAIRVRPDYAVARLNLALALEREGRVEDAIAQYEVLARDEKRYGDLHYRVGTHRAEQGRFAEALPHLQRVVALYPHRADFHSTLAAALAALGRPAEARAEYEETLRRDPARVEAHYNLALLLLQDGRVEEARGHLQRAREMAMAKKDADLVTWIQARLDGLPREGAASRPRPPAPSPPAPAGSLPGTP